MTTRAEHIQWCQTRALEYAARGDHSGAIASMRSDLLKHDDTAALVGNPLIIAQTMSFMTRVELETWIKGFGPERDAPREGSPKRYIHEEGDW